MIPVYKPYLPPHSLEHAHEALNSGYLTQGPYLEKCTDFLQNLLGVKHVLLTNNGTSATHLVAKALNKNDFNYLIVPNNCYVAAWNAFLFDEWAERHQKNHEYSYRTKIHSIDANLFTWNFDLKKLNQKIEYIQDLPNDSKIAILIVHNLGNIINVPELQRKHPDILFVEDNCEGFLGKYEEKYSGTASLASSISFYGNKNLTCGEGGAVIVDDADTYEYLKCLHGQGQSKKRFIHDYLGYNYRMTNVAAAILYGQLQEIEYIKEKKNELFKKYCLEFTDDLKITWQITGIDCKDANWMFGIRIKGNPGYEIAEKFFSDAGIEIRSMFYPISAHKYLKGIFEGSNKSSNAKLLNKECIILPSYPELSNNDFNHIVKTVKTYLNFINK